MSGALGLEQLKKLPSIVEGRRHNAQTFVDVFSNIPGIHIQRETGESSWFGFAILVNKGKDTRDKLAKVLSEAGVDCRPIVAGNFVRNPVVKYFDYEVHGELRNSDFIHDCGLFIGNHHYDISKELSSIAEIIREVVS